MRNLITSQISDKGLMITTIINQPGVYLIGFQFDFGVCVYKEGYICKI